MNISGAALPPKQPPITAQDREHPLFPTYQQHRAACSSMLVEADSFRNWLGSYERDLTRVQVAAHPKYPEFIEWMQTNQGGARRCPSGIFPHNFYFWLEGGRW